MGKRATDNSEFTQWLVDHRAVSVGLLTIVFAFALLFIGYIFIAWLTIYALMTIAGAYWVLRPQKNGHTMNQAHPLQPSLALYDNYHSSPSALHHDKLFDKPS